MQFTNIRFIQPTVGVCCLYALVCSTATPAVADQPTAEDVAALRAAVEANFEAHTNGDLKALMKTLAPRVTGQQRAEFENEFREYIKLDANLQIRLLSLDVINFSSPYIRDSTTGRMKPRMDGCYASAEVVQLTVPKGISHAELADYPKELSTGYRHSSAMLPSSEVVKYRLSFQYDYQDRRWKTFRITSKVRPVTRWPANTQDVLRGEEPNVVSRTGPSVRKFSGK
jgi:hypothetical protein